jgi:hypothetical protein
MRRFFSKKEHKEEPGRAPRLPNPEGIKEIDQAVNTIVLAAESIRMSRPGSSLLEMHMLDDEGGMIGHITIALGGDMAAMMEAVVAEVRDARERDPRTSHVLYAEGRQEFDQPQ